MLSDLAEIPNVTLGSFLLRLEVEEPRLELMEKARRELRETPDLARESLATLQDLLKGE